MITGLFHLGEQSHSLGIGEANRHKEGMTSLSNLMGVTVVARLNKVAR